MRYEDEIKGKQIKGSTKAKLGKLAGNPDLEARGNRERFAGKAEETEGRIS